ncbi:MULTISPECIES: lectin [Dyella]|nr:MULTISPECIES: lectin [Dyella]
MQILRTGLIVTLAMAVAACSHSEAPETTSVPTAAATATPVAAASVEEAPRAGALEADGMEGYGSTRFGMDESRFATAWLATTQGRGIRQTEPAPGATCHYAYPADDKDKPSLGFMFEDGRFARYDVRTDKEKAPGGGRVGMTKVELLALYAGKFEEQPAKYEARASTIRVAGAQGTSLVFDVSADGEVTQWRVGVSPQIDYVEGCG